MNTYLTERIQENPSGYTAAVAADIVGTNLDRLDQKALRVDRALSAMPHAEDVTMQSPPNMPEIAVRLRHNALGHWGLDPVSVLQDVHTAYKGQQVAY